ncbi:MAG: type III secretion system chaperone [Rhodospirillaceae bacterium]
MERERHSQFVDVIRAAAVMIGTEVPIEDFKEPDAPDDLRCQFQLASGLSIEVDFDSEADLVSLRVSLGCLPSSDNSFIVKLLLKANLFHKDHNNIFALSPENDEIILLSSAPLDRLDPERMAERIVSVAEFASSWSLFIAKYNSSAPIEAPAATELISEFRIWS